MSIILAPHAIYYRTADEEQQSVLQAVNGYVKAKQCDVGQNVFFWQRLTMKAPWGVCIERAVKEVSDPDAAKVCQAANWNLRQNASLT
jgi:hypothetical protein